MQKQVLQVGEGCDIEMHVVKNEHGLYFVSYHLFRMVNGVRTMDDKPRPVLAYNNLDDLYAEQAENMAGQKITI